MGSIPNGQRVIMLLLELYDVYPNLKNLSIKLKYSEMSEALGITGISHQFFMYPVPTALQFLPGANNNGTK